MLVSASRPRRGFVIVLAVALALPAASAAQDLSTFLSHPPAPGSWARYRVETRDPASPDAPPKVSSFCLAVTGAETRGNRSYFWLETSPMDLARDKDGTLRILIPTDPTPEEARNPFREIQAAQFKPREGESYQLSSSVVSMVRSQAHGAQVTQILEPAGTEARPLGAHPATPCEKAMLSTRSEGDFFFRHRILEETGTYWFSDQTPFRLVEATLERTETREGKSPRRRLVTVRLEEAGATEAPSAFPTPPTRTRGIFSLLFR